MAGKLCDGNDASLLEVRYSRAYCEGMQYRSGGTAAERPLTGNPYDSDGTEAETAWDAGWNYADDQSVPSVLTGSIDNDNFVLTGSIDPAASTDVVGVGTLFTTELEVGDEIVVSTETREVATIVDDLNLTVTLAFTDNADDTSPEMVGTRKVVGVGTAFTTELTVGDTITVSSEARVVASIEDDTHLTVTASFTDTANDTSPERTNHAFDAPTATCCNIGGEISA